MNENAKPDLSGTAALPVDKADPLATPASVSQRDDARSQQPLEREALDVFVAWTVMGIFII